MPRACCELCGRKEIIYRLYIDGDRAIVSAPSAGGKVLGLKAVVICQRCAEAVVKNGVVFNLRRLRKVGK